jgi:hypothetical protein
LLQVVQAELPQLSTILSSQLAVAVQAVVVVRVDLRHQLRSQSLEHSQSQSARVVRVAYPMAAVVLTDQTAEILSSRQSHQPAVAVVVDIKISVLMAVQAVAVVDVNQQSADQLRHRDKVTQAERLQTTTAVEHLPVAVVAVAQLRVVTVQAVQAVARERLAVMAEMVLQAQSVDHR